MKMFPLSGLPLLRPGTPLCPYLLRGPMSAAGLTLHWAPILPSLPPGRHPSASPIRCV